MHHSLPRVLALLYCLSYVSVVGSSDRYPIEAKFGQLYAGTVSEVDLDRLYNYNQSKTQAVRLSVWSDASEDFPVSFVVLEQRTVLSMPVPHVVDSQLSYSDVSHTLCPAVSEEGALSVRVTTFSLTPLNYTIMAIDDETFIVQTNQLLQVTAGPAEPMLLEYSFPEGIETVMLNVTSDSDQCAYLSVQKKECPVYDEFDNIPFTGTFQSMTEKAAITVVKKDYPEGFYIIIVVHPYDDVCDRYHPLGRNTASLSSKTDSRYKNLTVSVVVATSKYLEPVLITFGVAAAFYAFIGMIVFGYWLKDWCTGRASKLHVEVGAAQGGEGQNLVHVAGSSGAAQNKYGSLDIPSSSSGAGQDKHGSLASSDDCDNGPKHRQSVPLASGVPQSQQDPDARSHDSIDGFDTLDDIEEEQDVYLAKQQLFLCDTTRLGGDVRERKLTMYPWNLVTVAVFYALPVVQLVITYQIVLNLTGNQDTCYYNFLCSRPAGVFSAFNNVFSNVGYILMGILLWLLVWRREVIYKQSPQEAKNTGIPKHYSLFYALAIALVVEGVMSGCYHVCPNNTNFQFDTSFMYIIACLCMIKLYQQRHPDIDPEPHRAFVVFALIIFLGMLGVIFHNFYTYLIFFIIHITTFLYMSLHVYYKSTVRFDTGIFSRVWLELKNLVASKDFKPLYLGRFLMLLVGNGINWALSLFGLLTMPLDFASFLLSIFIINLLLYLSFYIIMKLFHRERLTPLVCFFICMTVLLWVPALYFFEQGVTAWNETPAHSRVHNKPCMVLDFYDSHDIWHFLSACGLFFSFMTILVLDDDLDGKPRDKIPVF